MTPVLIRFLKRIQRFIIPLKVIPKRNDFLINQGVVIVGERSEIGSLSVIRYANVIKTPNIIIGRDCIIQGSITLFNEDAKVIIGDRVFIGPDSHLLCYEKILVGSDVMISWGCTLIDTDTHSIVSEERKNDVLDWKQGWEFKDWTKAKHKPIVIKNKSWIGFNSIITKGVQLGTGCIVACGSVVTKSFGDFDVVGGNPASMIKKTS